MQNLSKEHFRETECHFPLAAIDLDYPLFLANFGEDSFETFKIKAAESGFIFRGILNDSAIFALPTPLLDILFEEINLILAEEVFAD